MARFPDTQWSLLRRSSPASSVRDAAFAELAREYRPAILAYLRARLPAHDAEDVCQTFLASSFEHQWWSRAQVSAGSFRSFLLLLLGRHLAHWRRRVPMAVQPIDDEADLDDGAPAADSAFDLRFALTLTQASLDGLRREYRERQRGALFDALARLLVEPPDHGELQRVAAQLGLAANTLSVELGRVRTRLRAGMRERLRELCADQASFEDEWAGMQAVLGRG